MIVNDFGEASLDEVALAEGEPFRITNIPGGCVCCTAPEGFVDALGAVLAQRPDRLLIEPTGLARPQDLVDTIRRCPHAAALELAPVVVLSIRTSSRRAGVARAAARAGAGRRRAGREPDRSRERERARRVRALCRGALARAARGAAHAARRAAARAARLARRRGARGERRTSTRTHHAPSTEGHHARSWRWSPDVVFSGRRLRDALAALAADPAMARFKGIFRTEEGVSRLEIAGGVLHDRLTSFRRDSRADAIARGDERALDRDRRRARGRRAARRGAPASIPNRIELVLPDGRVHAVDRAALAALPRGIADVSAQFPKRSGSRGAHRGAVRGARAPRRGHAPWWWPATASRASRCRSRCCGRACCCTASTTRRCPPTRADRSGC